jgi:hypothetical protein
VTFVSRVAQERIRRGDFLRDAPPPAQHRSVLEVRVRKLSKS